MRRRGLSSFLVVSAVSMAALGASEQAPHEALGMEEQERRLEALLRDRDPAQPPPGVDAEIWSRLLVPEDNAMTPERVALGRKLYFDLRLSADGTVSCATCHDVSKGFTDQRPRSEGIRDQIGFRNAPTTLNAVFMETQFLDGRAQTLEDQAKLPILNSVEMGQPTPEAAMKPVLADPEYRKMFQAAYGRPPNYDDLARAIAAFERTLVFLEAPFDRFAAGEAKAISDEAKLGFELYNGKARCVSCHPLNGASPIGIDNRFHNIGVAAHAQNFEALARDALKRLEKDDRPEVIDELALQTNLSELGRFLVTKNRSDIGAFKTLQVRNAGITAPYMHDGSMNTLWDVMDHYNKGGEENPFLDGGIEPLALTEQEIDAVVAFLFTLTDDRFRDQNQRALEQQRALAREKRPFRDEELAQRKVYPFERRLSREEKRP